MDGVQELPFDATKTSERPRDLSRDSLEWSTFEDDAQKEEETHIFTTVQFKDLGLRGHLADVIHADKDNFGFGLTTCTSVQSMMLPLFISGKGSNVLIKSQTGSGKTLAYVLPVLHELLGISPPVKRTDGCMALIISPTRELCSQIAEVVGRLTRCCVNIVPGAISGGEKKKSEKDRLRKGLNILVATPGRLLDHLKTTEAFSLQQLRFVILDEVDRLLDMGFEQSILEILSRISGRVLSGLKDTNLFADKASGGLNNLQSKFSQHASVKAKQTMNSITYIMASATLSDRVKTLALSILISPTHAVQRFTYVDGDSELSTVIHSLQELEQAQHVVSRPVSMVPSTLSQYYMLVHAKWRLPALLSFLYLNRHKKMLVFFSTCDGVDFHSLIFKHMQWPVSLDSKGEYIGDKNPVANTKGRKPAPKYLGENPANQEHHLDPLDSPFYGVFGRNTPMYRLHGQVPSEIRKKVYHSFMKSTSGILLCTDVAARGLDLDNVDWILQYDAPCDTMDYVHRVGRTARKGQKGSAMLFLQPNEQMYVSYLSNTHGLTPQRISPQSMFQQAAAFIPQASKFKNTDEMVSVILQRRVENTIYKNKSLVAAGVQAYSSALRAYNTHTADVKTIFRLKDLHLGHISKAFGLREKPSEMQKGEVNVIEQIFAGAYMKREDGVNGGGAGGTGVREGFDRGEASMKKKEEVKDDGQETKKAMKRKRAEEEEVESNEDSQERKVTKRSAREDFNTDAGYSTVNSSLSITTPTSRKTSTKAKGKTATTNNVGIKKRGIPLLRASGKRRIAQDKKGKRAGYFKKKLRSEFSA
ncbi:DEAD/DEAH box helicase [archaeon]|nr:MAG: DEAD/DEAH box helicase [archaeon]